MAKKTGRPTDLTPGVQETIANLIRSGNYIVDAAEIAGIDRQTVYLWINRGMAEGTGIYAEFAGAMAKARAESVALRVGRIAAAGKGGAWQADAWWLERVDPEKWGRKNPDIVINLTQSSEWLELREKIALALEPYPDAAEAVARVLSASPAQAIEVKALPEAPPEADA